MIVHWLVQIICVKGIANMFVMYVLLELSIIADIADRKKLN